MTDGDLLEDGPSASDLDEDGEIPDAEDGITLRGTEFKVSVTEKRSLGDYENISPHASIEGEFDGEAALDANRGQLRARLLALQRDLQAVVEQAADNRIKADGHEDWSDPLGGDDGG